MKVHDLIQQIRDFFRQKPELSDAMIERLIRSLEHTSEEELTCGEVYDLLDQYADANLHGEEAARLMPLLKQHLEICHDCYDEYEALLSAVQASAE